MPPFFFFIFILTCCKYGPSKENTLTDFFQNHHSKQTKHPAREKNEGGEGRGGHMQAKKFELPPCVGYTNHQKLESSRPSPDHRSHIENIFAGDMHFQLHNHNLFEKVLGTKSLNVKRCPIGLSPRIIPSVSQFLPKTSPSLMLLYYSYRCGLSSFP